MIHAPQQHWAKDPEAEVINRVLSEFGCPNLPWEICRFDGLEPTRPEGIRPNSNVRFLTPEQHEQVRSKLLVILGINAEAWLSEYGPLKGRISGSGRLTNILTCDGVHMLSMRLNDGALSLTDEGATCFAQVKPARSYPGVPKVIVSEHAVPFVKEGRNVFHGFIQEVSSELIVGMPCLILGPDGEAIAHGVPTGCATELLAAGKGMAVRVRGALAAQEP